jgi:ribosomal protein S18 acetylase RimI-like enzyme
MTVNLQPAGDAAISLRPISDADEPLLCALYASTRVDEMAMVDWSDEQKAAFLQMQFRAQHDYYHQHYIGAHFDVIQLDDVPVGRMYVHRMAQEYRLMEITLLPEYRGQGIGSALIRQVMDRARAEGVSVTLHVENYNRAYQLYRRMGFVDIGQNGVYTLLEWRADRQDNKS